MYYLFNIFLNILIFNICKYSNVGIFKPTAPQSEIICKYILFVAPKL